LHILAAGVPWTKFFNMLPLLMPPYSLLIHALQYRERVTKSNINIFYIFQQQHLRPTASISKELYTHEIEMKWNLKQIYKII